MTVLGSRHQVIDRRDKVKGYGCIVGHSPVPGPTPDFINQTRVLAYTQGPSLLSVAVTEHHEKENQLGREGFIWLTVHQKGKAGTEAEIVGSAACQLASLSLFSLQSYTTQDHVPRDHLARSGLGPPTSNIN